MSTYADEKIAPKGWGHRTLLDGRSLPEIGFGSWQIGSRSDTAVVDQVEQALDVGFVHLDTAQVYFNEDQVGSAVGLWDGPTPWVTTKWSGVKSISDSIDDSLKFLNLKSVDLYLIHSSRLTEGDPPAKWREFEALQAQGLAKSIGVSNFEIEHLEAIRLAKLSTPVVNQILLHPYVYDVKKKALLDYHAKHGIVTEAYSSLKPLTGPEYKDGPVSKALAVITKARGVSDAAVLFAWARAKGAVIVTTSSKRERLVDYLAAGEVQLTEAEIKSIDIAGQSLRMWKVKRRVVPVVLATAALAAVKYYFA